MLGSAADIALLLTADANQARHGPRLCSEKSIPLSLQLSMASLWEIILRSDSGNVVP